MRAQNKIALLCQAFLVSRSGYYDWIKRRHQPGARELENTRLRQRIRETSLNAVGIPMAVRDDPGIGLRGTSYSDCPIDALRSDSLPASAQSIGSLYLTSVMALRSRQCREKPGFVGVDKFGRPMRPGSELPSLLISNVLRR